MEFKRRWLGYDREEVNRVINQTTDANNAALANAQQLLDTLNIETERLEAELKHLQGRVEKSSARAERLEDSNYIVDMVFAIMKDALVVQRGEILQIAVQMAEELAQRCNELKLEANDIDITIGMMQKQIEEKLQLYQRILSGNSQEMARINGKYPELVKAQTALSGEAPASYSEPVIEPEERPSLQLVKNETVAAAAEAAAASVMAAVVNAMAAEKQEPAAEVLPEDGGAAPLAAASDAPAVIADNTGADAVAAPVVASVMDAGTASQAIAELEAQKAALAAIAAINAAPAGSPAGSSPFDAGMLGPGGSPDNSEPAVLSFADGSWHAFIIDDDSTVLAMLRAIFEREGAYVTEAIDGNVATALINEMAPPDVVILDLMLPYVDGFQLLMRMRNKPGWSKVPVVILSSRTSEQEAVKLLQAGASDYLTKPFNTRELMTRARMAMNRDPLAMQA